MYPLYTKNPSKGSGPVQAEFRRATMDDLAAMLEIVAAGKAFLKQQGVNQWQMGDPSEAGLVRDIEGGNAWVLCQNGRVMATMGLLFTPDASYADIDGAWANDEPYASMHRVALRADARGTGLGKVLMENVVARVLSSGYTTIRVDTHHDNLPMQKFLLKNGFTRRGDIVLKEGAEKGCPRVAFDRVLTP